MTSRDRCIQRQVERADGTYRQPTFAPGQVVEDHTCCVLMECVEIRRVTLVRREDGHDGWWQVTDNDFDDGVIALVHESDLQAIEPQGG